MARRTATRRPLRGAVALTAMLAALLTAGTLLAPAGASAAPATAAQVRQLLERTAQQLGAIDEQIQHAQLIVDRQQQAARAAAQKAARAQAAVDAFDPQLRAIAQAGYTAPNQSRVAILLTSTSASDLVQRMATLDVIATHTEEVISQVTAAQDAAAQAKAAADQAAAQADASLGQLKQQKAELRQQADQYQAKLAQLSATERAAVTAAVAGRTLTPPSVAQLVADAPPAVATVLRTALAQVGKPYEWGMAGPNGFDCSGLTLFAYAAAGISLPHSSSAQFEMGTPVSRADLRPGDLVFFYHPVSHVAIYLGNGMMVHARTFGVPVSVTSVDMAGLRGGRRIIQP